MISLTTGPKWFFFTQLIPETENVVPCCLEEISEYPKVASLKPELITNSPANFPRLGKVLLDLSSTEGACTRAKAQPRPLVAGLRLRSCLTPQGEVVVDLQTKGDIFTEP